MTGDSLHMTCDSLYIIIDLFFVIGAAHFERFSVSRMQDFCLGHLTLEMIFTGVFPYGDCYWNS